MAASPEKRNKWKTLTPLITPSTVEELLDIADDYEGKSTSNIRIKYPQEFVNLLELTKFLPEKAPFPQRIYHLKNNMYEPVKCSECAEKPVKWYICYNGYAQFCSQKCQASNEGIQEKRRRTTQKRYGVDHAMKSDEIKKKIFTAEYYKKVNSEEVKQKKKDTCMEKFGVPHPSMSEEVKKKISQTCMDRYDVTSYIQSEEARKRIRAKYGVEHGFQSKEIQEKIIKGNQELYGVDYPLESEDVRSDIADRFQEKHGVRTPFALDSIKEKIIKNNRDKYGVDYPLQSEKIKKHIKTTVMNRYGVEYILRSKEHQKHLTDAIYEKFGVKSVFSLPHIQKKIKNTQYIDKICHPTQQHINADVLDLIYNKEFLHNKHIIEKIPLTQICEKYLEGYDRTSLSYIMKNYHNIDVMQYQSSYAEEEISMFLNSINIPHIRNDRNVISPYEVDIIIPDKKIGIEFNGLFWHSEDFKTSDYHYNKFIQMQNAGYRLISIYEDEWYNNREIIEKKLKHILNYSKERRVYARNCNIVENINKKHVESFLNETHVQGYATHSYNITLFSDDTLVAVACYVNNGKDWVLTRFSTSLNVVGGFSKLLKHSKFDEVVTFSDNRWDTGNVYVMNGFEKEYDVPHDYYYVKGNKRYHKFNFRKSRQAKLFENYDPSLTERENMINNGYKRIYDCGKIKWRYKKGS